MQGHFDVRPISDNRIEFWFGGQLHTVAHSVEAAEKLCASMGYTFKDIKEAYTPAFALSKVVNELSPALPSPRAPDMTVIDVEETPPTKKRR